MNTAAGSRLLTSLITASVNVSHLKSIQPVVRATLTGQYMRSTVPSVIALLARTKSGLKRDAGIKGGKEKKRSGTRGIPFAFVRVCICPLNLRQMHTRTPASHLQQVATPAAISSRQSTEPRWPARLPAGNSKLERALRARHNCRRTEKKATVDLCMFLV